MHKPRIAKEVTPCILKTAVEMHVAIYTYYLNAHTYYELDDDLDHLLGMDANNQKRTSALYLMKMKEIYRLSQVPIDDIVEGSQSIFNHVVHRFRAKVHSKLSEIGIDENKLDDIFSDLPDPFMGLETRYKQEKYFREDFNLVVSYIYHNKFTHSGRLITTNVIINLLILYSYWWFLVQCIDYSSTAA